MQRKAIVLAVVGPEYDVVRAGSGPEAIEVVKSRSDIDVILMDVQMPVMDGFETAAQIKKIEGGQDLPIVFITAVYREDPHVKRGYQSGGIDYFSKPFDPDILKLKVGIYATFRQRATLLKEREQQPQSKQRAGRTPCRRSCSLRGTSSRPSWKRCRWASSSRTSMGASARSTRRCPAFSSR